MPVTFSSYRLGPGQRASYKTVPPPWDWLLRRENELGPRRSRSQITFAVLVPPLYVAVQAPALIVTVSFSRVFTKTFELFTECMKCLICSHKYQQQVANLVYMEKSFQMASFPVLSDSFGQSRKLLYVWFDIASDRNFLDFCIS